MKFRFKVDGEIIWESEMESVQCVEHAKNGERCKRKTVIGSPYCWTHLRSLHHLRIRPSGLAGAGKGLFAELPAGQVAAHGNRPVFKKGETIVKYHGEAINATTLVNRYGDNTAPYTVQVAEGKFEDAARRRGVGALANNNPGRNNARFSIYRGAASLKASKNIMNGQEIFLAYGPAYRLNEPGVQYSTK
jgi:hypothetical protein